MKWIKFSLFIASLFLLISCQGNAIEATSDYQKYKIIGIEPSEYDSISILYMKNGHIESYKARNDQIRVEGNMNESISCEIEFYDEANVRHVVCPEGKSKEQEIISFGYSGKYADNLAVITTTNSKLHSYIISNEIKIEEDVIQIVGSKLHINAFDRIIGIKK